MVHKNNIIAKIMFLINGIIIKDVKVFKDANMSPLSELGRYLQKKYTITFLDWCRIYREKRRWK